MGYGKDLSQKPATEGKCVELTSSEHVPRFGTRQPFLLQLQTSLDLAPYRNLEEISIGKKSDKLIKVTCM